MKLNTNACLKIEQRLLEIDGRRCRLKFELEFWRAIDEVAARRNCDVAQLIKEIRAVNGARRLNSKIRVFVLNEFRNANRNARSD